MQLIVAEKPAVARDLARVLGVRPSGEHCFEGAGRVITWCIGHLVELDEPAAYDARWKAWRLDTLPMLPAEFRLRPSRHAAAQLRAVARLLADRRFHTVVNACDAGREGELIFRYLVQFAGRCPPVQRLWISSLTDEAIRKGFAALRPGAQLDPLADAARSRSEADWLVGMNATRAVTARGRVAGDTALYSIGRVQTPTLAMLVRREQAIRAFVPRPYWEVRGTFTTAGGQRFTAGWRQGGVARLGSAAIAEAIAGRDTAHGAAADPIGPRVERVRARTVREPPPLLFDLTALQRTANRRFGLSAARTLEIAQALYERHKIITYPRTDARHLSSDVARELPALFAALAEVPDYAAFATELIAHPPRPGRRIIDDAKVHDHHAIIPTGKPVRIDALDRDERRLFDLIARRFLAAFYPDAEFAVTEAWIRVGAPDASAPALPTGEPAGAARGDPPERDDGSVPVVETLPPAPDRYLARGRVRRVAGWQAVAGIEAAAAARGPDRPPAGPHGGAAQGDAEGDTGAGAEPAQPLPPLVDGQALDGAFAPLAKQTAPPRRYTEATLLAAMESAGKAIDDEALRLAMKDCGLGTPATRAAIIETLLTRDYAARARQELVPTPRGIALIDALPVTSLASPELTGAWEARLARIARGQESRAAFMADIARYVTELVDAIRGASPPAAPPADGDGAAGAPVGRCPRCGAGVVERRRDFACTGGCGFAMPSRVAGRAIRAPLAAVLLERRRSQPLRGFRSKAGKPFSAALVLDDDGALRFAFEAAGRGQPPTRGGGGADPDPDAAPGPDPGSPSPTSAMSSTRAPARRRRQAARRGRAPGRAAGTADRASAAGRSQPTAARRRPSPSIAVDEPRDATRGAGNGTAVPAQPAADRKIRPPSIDPLGCPRCRVGTLIAGSRGWGCARWREGCRFVVWFETAGRRLTPAQLRDLVVRGKTRKARFRSDRGAEIDGRLVLDPAADGGARLEPARPPRPRST